MKCPRLLQCRKNCYYGLLCVLDNFFRIFQNNGEIYSSWSNYLVHPVHSNKFEYSLDDRVSRTPSSSSDFHRRLLRLRCYKSRNFVGPKQISSDKEKLKFGSCLTIYIPSSEKEEKPEERGEVKKSGGTGGEDFLAGIQIALLRELIPSRWRQDEIKKFADIFFSGAESVRFGARYGNILSPRRRTTAALAMLERPLERSRGRESAGRDVVFRSFSLRL